MSSPFSRSVRVDGLPIDVVVTSMPPITVDPPEGGATEETLSAIDAKLDAISDAVATEETLSAIDAKLDTSENVGGILSAYSGADDGGILRGNVSSSDLTTPAELIEADAGAYFRLEELHLSVLSEITVTLKVGSSVLWQFTGPGQDHFVSLFGLAPSNTGYEAVTIEADDVGDVTAFVAVRRIQLPSV